MSFSEDLRRFGPDAPPATVSREEAWSYCAGLAGSHYENFSVLTAFTPRRLRRPFRAIYAFCRWSDDLGDEVGDPAAALRLLGWWRGELRAMFEGRAGHPVLIALGEIVREHDLPPEPFEALISAFEQDQTVTEYRTYPQLLDYCRRSANPVGELVLRVSDAYSPDNAALSDATCTGLQVVNFWQDVARDLDIGRVYLPREDRERFGYSDEDLHDRRFNDAFAALMRFEVERAVGLLEAGRGLAARLSWPLDVVIDLFNAGGRAIAGRIAEQGYDVWSSRPVVTRPHKVGLIVGALGGRVRRLVGGRRAGAGVPA